MSDVGLRAPSGARVHLAEKAGATPYVAAVFLSATLVFLVQPLFAKMATPLLGGAPAVWNVALVCFQTALLGGYAYAHVLARLPSTRAQVAIHAVLLALAALALPLSISGLFGTPDPSRPVLWLAGTFLVSIAPPFAIISATAPLIQNWYARSGRPDAADPYHLYAASNVGSLAGLAAYPLLMEPFTTVSQQTSLWAFGYGELAILLVACGLLAMRGARTHQAVSTKTPLQRAEPRGKVWRERLSWLLLAAVPSGLLLSATTHISTDIASAPFIWAPPLMVYIGTFIIVFSKKPLIATATATRYLPHAVALALGLVATQVILGVPLPVSFGVHILALFIVALCLHGTLADRRPPADRLTEFYLVMSAGGVVGAAFPALIAPILFNGVFEYPLMLIAALLLRPCPQGLRESLRAGRMAIAATIALAALAIAASALGLVNSPLVYRCVVVILIAMALLSAQSRLVPVIALTAMLLVGWSATPAHNMTRVRSFFGVIKTLDMPDFNARVMMHGTTLHGAQSLDPAQRLTPMTYYHPEAPIGQVFETSGKTARSVGVVGLGIGSVACYAEPGQDYTFFEIDPIVANVAADTSRFTFLSSCTPDARIVLGDARITLGQMSANQYDLLLLDAFSSNSIPTHLLTREAMALYLSRLTPDGLLAFHISNRNLDLMQTVARVGGTSGAVMMAQNYAAPHDAHHLGPESSTVVILARSEAALAPYRHDPRWTALESDGGRPWTDNYSNILGAMLVYYTRP